ncbi:hypothetical protein MZI29_18270, partial [Clostridioides difficile]|nr:hypothetical protein [Clostridioides difficile]
SELLMISKTAVQKKYTYALKKIALMKYGEEAKKNMANSISPPPKNDPGGLISNTDAPTSIFLRMKK